MPLELPIFHRSGIFTEMKHVEKRHKRGCGVACLAMASGLTYNQALSYCPGNTYDSDGLYLGQLKSALERATGDDTVWKLSKRGIPVPFRHWTPKFSKEIVLLARLTPGVTLFAHFICVHRNRLHDPDSSKSVTLASAYADASWREWMILAELGQ